MREAFVTVCVFSILFLICLPYIIDAGSVHHCLRVFLVFSSTSTLYAAFLIFFNPVFLAFSSPSSL